MRSRLSVHKTDDARQGLWVALGKDAMSEIENVPGSPTGPCQHVANACLDRWPRRKHQRGIEIALNGEVRTETQRLGPHIAIQGNLDPSLVLAPWPAVEAGVSDVLRRAAGRAGHIFNLGHGILPESDPETLARIVGLVHGET